MVTRARPLRGDSCLRGKEGERDRKGEMEEQWLSLYKEWERGAEAKGGETHTQRAQRTYCLYRWIKSPLPSCASSLALFLSLPDIAERKNRIIERFKDSLLLYSDEIKVADFVGHHRLSIKPGSHWAEKIGADSDLLLRFAPTFLGC